MNGPVILAVLLGTILWSSTVGHKLLFFKSCPAVKEMSKFEIDPFIGKWYIIEIFSGINRCMTMTFLKQSDSELTLAQAREFYLLDKINVDYVNTYTGTVVIDNLARKADMTIKWPANILGSADFKIVDTDYKNYALIYDCQNLLIFSRVSFAILSREKSLDAERLNLLKQQIRDFHVDTSSLKSVDQSNCINKNAINDTVDYLDLNTFALLDEDDISSITDAHQMLDFLQWNVPENKLRKVENSTQNSTTGNYTQSGKEGVHKLRENDTHSNNQK